MSLLKPYHTEILYGDYTVKLERHLIGKYNSETYRGPCYRCKFYNIGCDLDPEYSEVREHFCTDDKWCTKKEYVYHPIKISDICS